MCHEEKPVVEFYRDRLKARGFRSKCKVCLRAKRVLVSPVMSLMTEFCVFGPAWKHMPKHEGGEDG